MFSNEVKCNQSFCHEEALPENRGTRCMKSSRASLYICGQIADLVSINKERIFLFRGVSSICPSQAVETLV